MSVYVCASVSLCMCLCLRLFLCLCLCLCLCQSTIAPDLSLSLSCARAHTRPHGECGGCLSRCCLGFAPALLCYCYQQNCGFLVSDVSAQTTETQIKFAYDDRASTSSDISQKRRSRPTTTILPAFSHCRSTSARVTANSLLPSPTRFRRLNRSLARLKSRSLILEGACDSARGLGSTWCMIMTLRETCCWIDQP